ncbi:anthrone oxygenase family protein [Umezawaea sp. Da 62-37]|uniref:anthrone oxygenase family protein n=1 Tax=Umezawaea sp. Da 62-37 TaxID=3075927 RepID=UPI0028F70BF0|nr:anthrone oxygenase family protein [Umezawaea sp. Da 62-37]WNV88609.1 anthrone oxygenase family protein [Umezawaea sp. Da 62-37]
MDTLRGTSLIGATLTTGLMAGLFFAYTCSVMPALRGVDDRAFVDAMQRINVAIVNGWFLLAFLGAAVLGVLAAFLRFGHAGFGWVLAGAILHLAAIAVTAAVNIPLNNALDAAGDPAAITDLAAVRTRFETTWVPWNLVRTLTSTAGFACLVVALRG